MRRKRAIGFSMVAAAGVLAAGTGCTHNHYYVTPGATGVMGDPCAPGTTQVITSGRPVIASPMLGSVCDEPPQGSAVATRGTPIASNAGAPAGAPPIYSRPLRRGGLAWRGANTQSLATTRVEGAYDDESTLK